MCRRFVRRPEHPRTRYLSTCPPMLRTPVRKQAQPNAEIRRCAPPPSRRKAHHSDGSAARAPACLRTLAGRTPAPARHLCACSLPHPRRGAPATKPDTGPHPRPSRDGHNKAAASERGPRPLFAARPRPFTTLHAPRRADGGAPDAPSARLWSGVLCCVCCLPFTFGVQRADRLSPAPARLQAARSPGGKAPRRVGLPLLAACFVQQEQQV